MVVSGKRAPYIAVQWTNILLHEQCLGFKMRLTLWLRYSLQCELQKNQLAKLQTLSSYRKVMFSICSSLNALIIPK